VGQNGTVDTFDGTSWSATSGNGGTGTLADVTCDGGSLNCYATGKQGVTLVTTNGGTSWTIKAGGGSQANQLNGISCLTASLCYAAGNAGTVLKTSDGGQSWLTQTSGTTQNLNGVSCGSATGCAAVGAAGGPTTLSAAAAVGATNIKVASVTGFVVGQTITVDTGANLETVTATTVGTAGATGTGITFTPALALAHASGVAVAGQAIVRFTTDGSAWNGASGTGNSSLNGVACRTASACAAVGAAGSAITSADGGATWAASSSGTTQALNAITCPSAACYAVGNTGTILASPDGGASWSAQTSGTTQTLSGIGCANAANCIADGTTGTVLESSNGGGTWTQRGNPLSGPVSAINATNIALNGGFCTSARCLIGTGAQGDILTSPLLTVTVHTTSAPGTTPNITLPASSSHISYSPASEAGNVTGTLTCQTTATSASPVGTYPISNCSGLADDGFTVVYDYANSSHRVVSTPITTASVSPPSPNGANGWYVTAPVVTLSATAGELPLASTHYSIDGGPDQTYSGPFSISADGVHTVSFYSVDTDGNAETAQSITLKVDLHDPTTTATLTPGLHNGWYASPTLTLSATDGAGSGVDHISYALDGGTFQTYTGPVSGFTTGNHFVQYRATDVAGRVESTQLIAFKVDAVPPTVNIARPQEGDDFKLGQVVNASYKCADKQSGLDSCDGDVPNGSPIDTSTVGDHTFTVTGTDIAGHVVTVTHHYHVRFAFQGFFSPVSNSSDQKLNLVHAGDLIRVGFGLDGNRGLDVFGAGSPSSEPVECPGWAPHSVNAAGNGATTGLSFSSASGHYVYGWQTSGTWAGTCRELHMVMTDGTLHKATFLFFG
ncbi:MAG TPA: PxKF domain-containing protein, partial [Gaiellaceae bacterium]